MKIVAIMPARNEDWVLGLSARALLHWVDELIILDHASIDRTGKIILDLMAECSRVVGLWDTDPLWLEMAHRQRLLETARARGATHVVAIDADEVVSGNLLPHMRDIVADIPPGMVLQLPWITCRDSIYARHRTGLWAEQYASAAFVDDPRYHWQQRSGYDFHQRAPMGRPEVPFKPISHAGGGILHLQYSSRRRLLAKQALYKMTEVIRWPGRDSLDAINARYNWSVYGQSHSMPLIHDYETGAVISPHFDLATVPAEWWAGYEDLMQHLHVDAEPWQEAECKRLLGVYGTGKFAGLDLFGVV